MNALVDLLNENLPPSRNTVASVYRGAVNVQRLEDSFFSFIENCGRLRGFLKILSFLSS